VNQNHVNQQLPVHPRTGQECQEGKWKNTSTLSVILALNWGGRSMPHPGRVTPWKDPVPII